MTNPKPWRPYGDYTDRLPMNKTAPVKRVEWVPLPTRAESQALVDRIIVTSFEFDPKFDTEPLVSTPDWVEPVLLTIILSVALICLLFAGWTYLNAGAMAN